MDGSRRSVQKRVVSVPISGDGGSRPKGGSGGEGAPPTDSWAWRKYGQKPIKGSPYPRLLPSSTITRRDLGAR